MSSQPTKCAESRRPASINWSHGIIGEVAESGRCIRLDRLALP